MYGLQTLKRINREAKARSTGELTLFQSKSDCKVHTITESGGISHAKKSTIAREDRIRTLFVDISGFGGEHEPALTIPQFLEDLKTLVELHGPIEVGIVNHGQFQAYVGVWPATS